MKKQTIVLIVTFVLVLAISGWASYYLSGRRADRLATQESNVAAQQRADDSQNADSTPPTTDVRARDDAPLPVSPPSDEPTQTQAAQTAPARRGGESFFSQLFDGGEAAPVQGADENWGLIAARITVRFVLAVLLATLLAYRPRKRTSMFQRNPYVAQTQILLAVVASALMMVVGDSAARAFGIFAAASLVRFRTNISDPKEITVLLVSLAIGLATGVGHWEVAVVLCLFVLVVLWVLEYYEPSQAFRSMEITITTRQVDGTNRILRRILRKHRLNFELREIDREDADEPMGRIVYHVNVSLLTSTDTLSREIFSLDPENIDSIVWSQKKVPSIYT
ncbi:MAG TPA: DUF4956 domain-containing protein [Pyrinomonadaceae bacterium]|jgi:hypothetical protein